MILPRMHSSYGRTYGRKEAKVESNDGKTPRLLDDH